MHDLRERANYDAEAHAPDERTRYGMPAVKPAQAFAALRERFGAAAARSRAGASAGRC